METRSPRPVSYVDVAQEGDQVLSTSNGIVGCRDVQGGLPVLVPRIDVCLMAQQCFNSILKKINIIFFVLIYIL